MATTDTRSGFRLPWSSDRSHDAHGGDETMSLVDEAAPIVDVEPPADEDVEELAPEDLIDLSTGDIDARLGLTPQPSRTDPSPDATTPDASATTAQEPAMIDLEQTPPAPVAPRKPSKLMADLSLAIRSTAEAARDQALAQVDEAVAAVIEAIRVGSKTGEDALRVRTDEDIARIKEWSRAEIARIKEETEHRIEARKVGLEEELGAHATAIEGRVAEVEGTVAAYRSDMDAYSERLNSEDDPSRLATLAESMPEPPELEAWADLSDLAVAPAVVAVATDVAEAVVADDPGEPAGAVAEAGTAEGVADALEPGAADVQAEPDAIVDADAVADASTDMAAPGTEPVEAEAGDAAPGPWGEAGTSAWGETEAGWAGARPAAAGGDEDDIELGLEPGGEAWGDGSEQYTDIPRWTAGDSPNGFPAGESEGGEPVDRGAIMAALEAAAEAVVAAESAAESADQAEAAADVAETAAELIKGHKVADDETDPEAQAALSARMGAGGLEESYTDRLASLLPGHGEGTADGEPRTTQIIVSGLVSVASIASFKRHLGRLSGVQAVAVASGPDGEFVFNVTHRPDVSFRDALPTMPGFAARVTGTGDGVVNVTARDPEVEG